MSAPIVLTVFPALNGDSMLLSIGQMHILIDSGYVDTYARFIKAEISEIYGRGEHVELVVITHIDADHISGAIALFKENNKLLTAIKSIWHNSYRHISTFECMKTIDLIEGQNVENMPTKSIVKNGEKTNGDISASQGSSLAGLIQRSSIPWNIHSNGSAISRETVSAANLSEGVSLKVLSPDKQRLYDLHRYWKKELYKLGYKMTDKSMPFDDAFEFVIGNEKENKKFIKKNASGKELDLADLSKTVSTEDDKVSNGSSIAFILEYVGRRLLFLGDSHPSVIVASLKLTFKASEFPIKFDAIKISHHGSALNTSMELLEMIDSESFIISTNGNSFNHPDIETIARIVVRKSIFKRTLFFNYPNPALEKLNKSELMEKYNYTLVFGSGNEPLEIKI